MLSFQGFQSSTVCVGSCEGADGLVFCSKGLEAEAARMTSLSEKESIGCSDIQSCKTTCSFRVLSGWLLFKIINFVNMCFCSSFFFWPALWMLVLLLGILLETISRKHFRGSRCSGTDRQKNHEGEIFFVTDFSHDFHNWPHFNE